MLSLRIVANVYFYNVLELKKYLSSNLFMTEQIPHNNDFRLIEYLV